MMGVPPPPPRHVFYQCKHDLGVTELACKMTERTLSKAPSHRKHLSVHAKFCPEYCQKHISFNIHRIKIAHSFMYESFIAYSTIVKSVQIHISEAATLIWYVIL